MAKAVGIPGSSLIHFLLVEMRGIFVFYLGAKTIILDVGFQAYLPVALERSGGMDHTRLQSFISEVQNGVMRAMVSPDLHYVDANGVVKYPDGTNVLWVFHYVVIVIVAVFIIGMLAAFFGQRAWYFSRGDYIAFTWELERSILYKCISWMLFASTVMLVVGGFLYCQLCIGRYYSGLDFVRGNKFPLLSIFFSTYSLTVPPPQPTFHYRCSEFRELNFKRSVVDCVLQSNDYFAMKLSNTILGSVRYHDEELMQTLEQPEIASSLIRPSSQRNKDYRPILEGIVHHEMP